MSIKKGQDGIGNALERALKTDFFSAWAKRRLPELYADFQKMRFITENTIGGGAQWAPVTEPYKTRKRRIYGGGPRFAVGGWTQVGTYPSYPGGGRKTNIATSRLLAGILPPKFRGEFHQPAGEEFRMIVEPKRVIMATAVPYAEHVDKLRPFTEFPEGFKKALIADYAKYLGAAIMRGRED